MKVIIADDHPLFRSGLEQLFKEQTDFQIVGETGLIQELLTLVEAKDPDIVLMGLDFPDGWGLNAISEILQKKPNTNIIFLTAHTADEYAFTALQLGAKGFLLKNISKSALLTALRGLERDELAVPRTLLSRFLSEIKPFLQGNAFLSEKSSEATLTRREIDIVIALGNGLSNKEIANTLMISVNTVKVHVHNILRKLNLKNRREAAQYARRLGLVSKNNNSF